MRVIMLTCILNIVIYFLLDIFKNLEHFLDLRKNCKDGREFLYTWPPVSSIINVLHLYGTSLKNNEPMLIHYN